MEITNEMWEKAVLYTEEMLEKAIKIGINGVLYVMECNELLRRYSNGERTQELYEEMNALR